MGHTRSGILTVYWFEGIEDEVVIEYIFNILETEQKPDPRIMQINLTGFLESKTKVCMSYDPFDTLFIEG